MAKVKTTFFCQSCGHQSAKWVGKCPSCNSWNTFVEEIQQKNEKPQVWKTETRSVVAKPRRIEESVIA